MYLKLLAIVFYFTLSVGQKLDDNVCYTGVQPRLDELIDLYTKSPSISNVTIFSEIYHLKNEVDDIIPNIVNLENVLNATRNTQDIVNNELQNIDELKKMLELLQSLIKEATELNERKDIHDEAFNTCTKANQLYEELKNDTDTINKTGNAVKDAIEQNLKQMEDANAKNSQIQKELDDVVIPTSLFRQYVCDSNLQSTIQSIIDSIRNIADILKQKIQGVIQEELKKIDGDIDKIAEDINEIQKGLEEDIPESNIDTTDETPLNIEKLKSKLNNLKDKLKNLKLDQTTDDYLNNVRKRFKDLADEYETMLKTLFSKENMDKVREELKLAKETLGIINDRDILKNELDEIKKMVETMEKGGVCSQEKIDVEDSV